MNKLIEYVLSADCVFLVVVNLKSKNEYCFKFNRKPFKNFWFVSVQTGTWLEKSYPAICTLREDKGNFTVQKNAKFDDQFEYAFNCLNFLFNNLDDKEKMKEMVKLHFGKINLA